MNHSHKNYEPIEDYGIIGNLQTVALVSLKGSIDFMSFPRFDAPTVFAALLDADKGGFFAIRPLLGDVSYRQLYLPDTAVLLTRFFSDGGIAEVTDYMPVSRKETGCAIVRRVNTVRGSITYRMECAPRFDYARVAHTAAIQNNEILFEAADEGRTRLRLLSDHPLEVREGDGFAEFTLEESSVACFVLESIRPEGEPAPADLDFYKRRTYHPTINFWKGWILKSHYKGRWRELVHRSAITLKLLTSNRYGSVVAAPTFSLPETLGGNRNWDYRYTWIRDAAFTMYAFLRLGFMEEAGAFLKWIQKQCATRDLRLLYAIDGNAGVAEEVLPHLSGYKDSRPVRIGNGAQAQFQLDIYGELLDTIYLYNEHGGAITYEFWLEIVEQVAFVVAHWKEPDHGIWEIRSAKKPFLHTRLMCWVALDRAIKIAESRSFPYPASAWRAVRDEIFNDVYHNFWNEEKGAFVQHEGSASVDASALLMPLMRIISPHEARWKSTMEVIDKDLRLDVLIYRYRNDLEKIDGLDGEEGTFTMCSFWYIECLAKCGQVERAQENFEKMIGYANHLGLFSEQLGKKGEHLGNFPQAFTHLALISAAYELNKDLDAHVGISPSP